MKKIPLIFSAAIFFTCGPAYSQEKETPNIWQRLVWEEEMLNIMIDTRFDFNVQFPTSGGESWNFEAQTIKLWFMGEIVPGVRYRLRQRLNKPQTPLREGYSSATDHAWIAFDVGRQKAWTITAGKQSVAIGNFEFDYNPADVYMSTMINNDLDSYKAGVNVAYRWAGQQFNVQVVNSDSPQFAAANYSKKGMAANFLWEGSLWKGVVKTRWGYGTYMHTKSKWYNWVTPGTQLNIRKFTAEADYYYGIRNYDFGTVVGDQEIGAMRVRDQSLSLNLKYDLGRWKPALKGMWNDRYDKTAGTDAYSLWGVQATVELYPFTNKYLKDLRFHAAYWYTNTEFKGQWSARENLGVHTALVGMRWFFKVK